MKKLFSILVLSAVLLLPMGAKALKLDPKNACEKSDPCEAGKCTNTCKINFSENTDGIDELSFNLKFGEGISIKEIKADGDWILESGATNKEIKLSSASGKITDKSFTAATVVFNVANNETDCSIDVDVKGTVTTIVETVTKPPKTGAALPVAVLAFGACTVGVIYFTTKRNKKLYKI